jgi:hypothetical protein
MVEDVSRKLDEENLGEIGRWMGGAAELREGQDLEQEGMVEKDS